MAEPTAHTEVPAEQHAAPAAFGIVHALHRAGVRTCRRDLPVNFQSDWRDLNRYQGLELFDTTLYVAAVNTFPSVWYPRCGLFQRPGVRRIAVWYWELEDLPPDLAPRFEELLNSPHGDRSQAIRQLFEELAGD